MCHHRNNPTTLLLTCTSSKFTKDVLLLQLNFQLYGHHDKRKQNLHLFKAHEKHVTTYHRSFIQEENNATPWE